MELIRAWLLIVIGYFLLLFGYVFALILFKSSSPFIVIPIIMTLCKCSGTHIGRGRSARALQTTYIIQGIGQAIEYLYYGMDYSYLVNPQLKMLEHLPYMLEKVTPIGLILFDRNFNFKEILKAKKVQIYSSSERELVEYVYFGKETERAV